MNIEEFKSKLRQIITDQGFPVLNQEDKDSPDIFGKNRFEVMLLHPEDSNIIRLSVREHKANEQGKIFLHKGEFSLKRANKFLTEHFY